MKIWQQILLILTLSLLATAVSYQLKPVELNRMSPLAITAQSFYAEQDSYVVLDIRSLEKYQAAHFPNSIHFNPSEWENSLALLMEKFTGQEKILVYCDRGCNSAQNIVENLREAGFKEAYFLHKGYESLVETRENQ